MDDLLRQRSVGAPAARSVLLTVLGEYVLPRSGTVWQEALVKALGALGYTPHAARRALARSVRAGWLATERRGRRARVHLTDSAAELLRTGAARIYSFGHQWSWDGRWLMVVLRVPEDRREVRHKLRTQLEWAGLGSLGGGLWLTPHIDREAEIAATVSAEPAADILSFHAELGELGETGEVVSTAWELGAVRQRYEEFIEDFARARPSTDEACFRMQTTMVHAWRKFPFLDPDLPAQLLPANWPRQRAFELFQAQHARWQDPARAYFNKLETSSG